MFTSAKQAHKRFALLHTFRLSSPAHLHVRRIVAPLSDNHIGRVPHRLIHTTSAMTEASKLKYIDVGSQYLHDHLDMC
jgi:hypothetical protein